MKKKEEEGSAKCSSCSGERLWSFEGWLISFCGLEDIDIITQLKSSVWQCGDSPSPSPLETTLAVSICNYDLIHIYSKWHSYHNRSFHTRDKGQNLATYSVPRGWSSKKNSPRSLSLPRGKRSNAGSRHVSLRADGRRFVCNVELVKEGKAFLIEIKKTAWIYLVVEWFVIHSCLWV